MTRTARLAVSETILEHDAAHPLAFARRATSISSIWPKTSGFACTCRSIAPLVGLDVTGSGEACAPTAASAQMTSSVVLMPPSPEIGGNDSSILHPNSLEKVGIADARRADRCGRGSKAWRCFLTLTKSRRRICSKRSSGGKVKLQPGDAVLIHTGWGRLWGKDNALRKDLSRRRRRGSRVACEADPILVGADNWPVEVAPNRTRSSACPATRSSW